MLDLCAGLGGASSSMARTVARPGLGFTTMHRVQSRGYAVVENRS